jgi:hypothetical protein
MKSKKLGRWVAVASLAAAVALAILFAGGVSSADEHSWGASTSTTVR